MGTVLFGSLAASDIGILLTPTNVNVSALWSHFAEQDGLTVVEITPEGVVLRCWLPHVRGLALTEATAGDDVLILYGWNGGSC